LNVGATFPVDDSTDIMNGAEHIPFEVTDARRTGQRVVFNHEGPREDWYWQMPDGSKIYHDRREGDG